jgi:cytochrome b
VIFTVGAVLLVASAVEWVRGTESAPSRNFQIAAQLIGVAVVTLVVVLLDRRWKRFLTDPPALQHSESRADKLLVMLFRALYVASVVLVAAVIILVREF